MNCWNYHSKGFKIFKKIFWVQYCIPTGPYSWHQTSFYYYRDYLELFYGKVFALKFYLWCFKWIQHLKLSIKRVQNFQKIFWVQYYMPTGSYSWCKTSFYYYRDYLELFYGKVFALKFYLWCFKWIQHLKLSIKRVQNFQKIFWVQYYMPTGSYSWCKTSFYYYRDYLELFYGKSLL